MQSRYQGGAHITKIAMKELTSRPTVNSQIPNQKMYRLANKEIVLSFSKMHITRVDIWKRSSLAQFSIGLEFENRSTHTKENILSSTYS